MLKFTNSNNAKPIADEVTAILKGLKEIIFGRIRKHSIKPTPAILSTLKFPAAHLIRIISEHLLTEDDKKTDLFVNAMQTRVQLPGDFIPQSLAVHLANYLNEMICLEQEANNKGIFYSENQRDLAIEYVKEIQSQFK